MELELKSVKEIAADIGKSRFYVHAAKKAMALQGINWPSNQFTTAMFLEWCAANNFRCTGYGQRVPR